MRLVNKKLKMLHCSIPSMSVDYLIYLCMYIHFAWIRFTATAKSNNDMTIPSTQNTHQVCLLSAAGAAIVIFVALLPEAQPAGSFTHQQAWPCGAPQSCGQASPPCLGAQGWGAMGPVPPGMCPRGLPQRSLRAAGETCAIHRAHRQLSRAVFRDLL